MFLIKKMLVNYYIKILKYTVLIKCICNRIIYIFRMIEVTSSNI